MNRRDYLTIVCLFAMAIGVAVILLGVLLTAWRSPAGIELVVFGGLVTLLGGGGVGVTTVSPMMQDLLEEQEKPGGSA